MTFLLCLLALLAPTVLLAQTAPVLNLVDPPNGAPGTVVTLTGENLVRTNPAFSFPRVTFCGQDATVVELVGESAVLVQAPEHRMGINQWCDVTLSHPEGSSTVAKGFTYYNLPPIPIQNRDFRMGFVPILLGPTEDPLMLHWYWNDARDIAASHGDIVSLLSNVWDHCDGGVPVLADLSSAPFTTAWFHENGVAVMHGLEITTGIRDNVGYCPDATFDEQHVKDGIESQVRFLFETQGPGPDEINYPDYLMLGIEMNMYYIARPWDWDNYKMLLDHLYGVVHEYTTKTKVVVSFQFEVLTIRGHLPRDTQYPRQWEIYGDLALDVYGISVYPGMERFVCFWDPSWMPLAEYELFTDPAYNPRGLPIAITETGYMAVNSVFFCGSEFHQHSYLTRVAKILQENQAEFMIWWFLHEGADQNMIDFFTTMRLVTEDRACYPDCFPFEPDCEPECPLDPQGSMALDTWRALFALPPSPD